jgi:hypothetical protein
MNDKTVTCAMCGHQFPAGFVRGRGAVTCSCGMRIDGGPAVRTRHHLRNLLFLFVTALLVALVGVVGHRLLG